MMTIAQKTSALLSILLTGYSALAVVYLAEKLLNYFQGGGLGVAQDSVVIAYVCTGSGFILSVLAMRALRDANTGWKKWAMTVVIVCTLIFVCWLVVHGLAIKTKHDAWLWKKDL